MSVRLASKEVFYFSVGTDNIVTLSKLTFLHILRSVYQKGWLYFNNFFPIAHLEVADSKDKQGIC